MSSVLLYSNIAELTSPQAANFLGALHMLTYIGTISSVCSLCFLILIHLKARADVRPVNAADPRE